ncbi:MAG: hypothetical protein WBO49_02180 [Candidatus Saccharimonas sp.]
MKSLRVFDGHLRYAVLAVTLVLAVVAPAFASAAQLTERSIALSSSSKAATGVSYNIKFTQGTNQGAVVIQFCTNSPLIGEFCDAPSGMVVSGATAGAGVTAVSSTDNTTATIKLTKSGATGDLTLTGITNPSAAGTVFARILTYADDTAANSYVVTDSASALGSPVDQGAVAIAFTDTVAVSGAVLEALTFCVSGTALTGSGCAGSTSPVLTLGEDVGDGTKALIPTATSTGNVYTRISTNAVSGAIVSLKSTAGDNSGTPCGGLALNGTGACSIAAAGTTGSFANGAGKFGVKIAAPADSADGEIRLASNYDADDYRLDGAAVIGTYGDPIFNTNGGYANDRNTTLTFGATSANNTPAGKYSTSISLVATGTF